MRGGWEIRLRWVGGASYTAVIDRTVQTEGRRRYQHGTATAATPAEALALAATRCQEQHLREG